MKNPTLSLSFNLNSCSQLILLIILSVSVLSSAQTVTIQSHPTDTFFNSKGNRFFPGTISTVTINGGRALTDFTIVLTKKDSLTATILQTMGSIKTDVNGLGTGSYTLDCAASGQTVFVGATVKGQSGYIYSLPFDVEEPSLYISLSKIPVTNGGAASITINRQGTYSYKNLHHSSVSNKYHLSYTPVTGGLILFNNAIIYTPQTPPIWEDKDVALWDTLVNLGEIPIALMKGEKNGGSVTDIITTLYDDGKTTCTGKPIKLIFNVTPDSVQMVTGTSDTQLTLFKIFPNPKLHGMPLNIQTEVSQNYDFRMFDLTGRLALHTTLQGTTALNNINLPSGLYLYDLTTGDQHLTGKILLSEK